MPSPLDFVTGCLVILAFGMGLGLRLSDFGNIALRPKSVFVGSLGQIILLPTVATLLAALTGDPVIVVGLLLIAVCPGGSTSNYFTFLAKGDVALSISLTAISGALAVLTVPNLFNISAGLLLDQRAEVLLPVWETMRRILLLLVLPVFVGMLVKRYRGTLADRLQVPVATGGFVLVMVMTPAVIIRQGVDLASLAGPAFFWCAVFIPTMMAIGHLIARNTNLPLPQQRALPIEIGVQNVALALVLALTFFDDPRYTAVPLAYLILMLVFVPAYVVIARKQAITTASPPL